MDIGDYARTYTTFERAAPERFDFEMPEAMSVKIRHVKLRKS